MRGNEERRERGIECERGRRKGKKGRGRRAQNDISDRGIEKTFCEIPCSLKGKRDNLSPLMRGKIGFLSTQQKKKKRVIYDPNIEVERLPPPSLSFSFSIFPMAIVLCIFRRRTLARCCHPWFQLPLSFSHYNRASLSSPSHSLTKTPISLSPLCLMTGFHDQHRGQSNGIMPWLELLRRPRQLMALMDGGTKMNETAGDVA